MVLVEGGCFAKATSLEFSIKYYSNKTGLIQIIYITREQAIFLRSKRVTVTTLNRQSNSRHKKWLTQDDWATLELLRKFNETKRNETSD